MAEDPNVGRTRKLFLRGLRTPLGAVSVLLGGVAGTVGGVIFHYARVGPPRQLNFPAFAPVDGATTSRAYSSSFSVTYAPSYPSWLPSLPIAIAVGILLGGLCAAILARSGWALTRRDRPS